METSLDITDYMEPLFPEIYPTSDGFDFADFLTVPQDDLANLPLIHDTPPVNDPTTANNVNSTQSKRPLLPRISSEPVSAPMPMYSTLPNGCRDNSTNGEQINDIYQRLMTI